MNITLVGTGNMGAALATRLAKTKHRLTIVSKDPARAAALAEQVGGRIAPAWIARSQSTAQRAAA